MAKRNTSKEKSIQTIKLFKVVNGILTIDKDEIRGIPEFHAVLSRRKTCKGDHDGRKKVMAYKELLYVKSMADYDSIVSAFGDKERNKRSKQDAGLPQNWVSDSIIKAAIKKYSIIVNEYSATAAILSSLKKGLMMSSKAVEGYTSQMETALEASSKLTMQLGEKDVDIVELTNAIDSVNSLVQANSKQILAIAKALPAVLKEIRNLQDQVKLERSESQILKGDVIKGNREDPK